MISTTEDQWKTKGLWSVLSAETNEDTTHGMHPQGSTVYRTNKGCQMKGILVGMHLLAHVVYRTTGGYWTWRHIHTEGPVKIQDFMVCTACRSNRRYDTWYAPSGDEYCVPNERRILDMETNPQKESNGTAKHGSMLKRAKRKPSVSIHVHI